MTQRTLSKTQFLTIIWVLFGIALTFLTARIAIRIKVYRRLLVDDGLVILALTCLLAIDIAATVMVPTIYTYQDVQINHHPKPSDYQAVADSYAKYQWATAYLYFTGIWAVKGSFLAYYDDLTKRLVPFRRAWWLAIGFTVLTYIGSLFAYAFLNGISFRTDFKNKAIKYQFAADLSTDVFITLIPVTLALKSSQTLDRQRLFLIALFSSNLIITVFAIIRFSLNAPDRPPSGPSWIDAWSAIEHSVSVTVACLASFRVYVVDKRRKSASDRAKNKAGSSLEKSVRSGLSDIRTPWGSSSREPKGNGSMELQLLDAPTSKTQTPAPTAGSGRNTESGSMI
ncbi:hypothetical protein BDR22DRAFT_637462 [Usnea florida]